MTREDRQASALRLRTIGRCLRQLVLYVMLIAFAGLVISPFVWMLSTSVTPAMEVFAWPPRLIPSQIQLSNYRAAAEAVNLPRLLLNSLIVSGLTTVSVVILDAVAGYALAKLRFPGRRLIFLLILGTIMIPTQVTMIPLFIMFRQFPLAGGNDLFGQGGTGLLNTHAALILPGIVSTFGIYLMREFFRMLPSQLIDAARVDGCSEFKIFRRVMLPLAKPAMTAVALFSFTFSWNEFLWPLLMTSKPAMRTVQLGLSAFKGQYFTDWHLLMAATAMGSAPVLIVYLLGQKHFVKGVAMSGMKG